MRLPAASATGPGRLVWVSAPGEEVGVGMAIREVPRAGRPPILPPRPVLVAMFGISLYLLALLLPGASGK